MPVFYDPAGRRWRRIRAVTGVAILAVTMVTAGFTVLAVPPLWPVPVNQANGYAAQLLSQRGRGTLPVIGGEGNEAWSGSTSCGARRARPI